MGQVSASSTILIDAEPATVLDAIADYQTVRPKILSPHYSEYQVLQGGQGQGTVATWKLQATKSRVARGPGRRRRGRPHRHREGRQLLDGDQLDRRPGRTRLAASPSRPPGTAPAASRASSRRRSRRWGCARSRTRCWPTSRTRSKQRAPSWFGAAGSQERHDALGPRRRRTSAGPPGSPSAPSRPGSSCCPARPGSTGTAPGSARRCRRAG